MSIIGPRPALWNQDFLTAERDKYDANDIKPGLTGLAQISGRDELEIPVKAKYDGVYAKSLKDMAANKNKKEKYTYFSINRAEKKDYTCMHNQHLRSKNLSLKAIGLLSKVYSLPDEWNFTVAGLIAICKESETAVRTAMKELEEWGYLKITKLKPDQMASGRIEYEYVFYEYSELTRLLLKDTDPKKCMVVFFLSGKEDLYTATENLLLANLGCA